MSESVYEDCNHSNEVFQIQTLGDFSVHYCDDSLTDAFENSQKLLELFTYFISYRNELILPEKIIDEIWPDSEFSDPKRTLRALVFRLRKTLSHNQSKQGSTIITYTNGCYKFNANEHCKIDIEKFETTYKQATVLHHKDRVEAIKLYERVIQMYRGGYLKKTALNDWLIPFRNQYHHMFLHSCSKVMDYLAEEGRNQEIVTLSEDVMRLDVFSEYIHFHYVDSLAKLGELVHAKSHVSYVQKILDRELGVTSCEFIKKMNEVIRRQTISQVENTENNSNINRLFHESKGPVVCGYNFFELYQTIEVQRNERLYKNLIWGTISIHLNTTLDTTLHKLPELMEILRVVLVSNLREGDVISQNSDNQFSISLSTDNLKHAETVLDRVQKKFKISCDAKDIEIKSELYQYPTLNTN